MALKLNAINFQSQRYSSPMLSLRSHKVFKAATRPSAGITEVKKLQKEKVFLPPGEVHVQVTHSMPPEKLEIFNSLEGWARQNILIHLKPVEKCWQPHDFLPDPASDGFYDQVRELRERTRELPDDYLVVLVGDMITEEALPTYQTMFNTFDGVRDETGSSPISWAIWSRAWSAEEKRHGDLLSNYLYLSGRVDMRQIQKTIQYLIASGMDPKTENNPYLGLTYTAFQESATFISHRNTSSLAREHGDIQLAKICRGIAADEKRHETAYTKAVEKLFEIDPDGTVIAFADMMRKKISMPGQFMYDGRDHDLFDHFSAVAQRLGVYTARDYADILEFLVASWKVPHLTGLLGPNKEPTSHLAGYMIESCASLHSASCSYRIDSLQDCFNLVPRNLFLLSRLLLFEFNVMFYSMFVYFHSNDVFS